MFTPNSPLREYRTAAGVRWRCWEPGQYVIYHVPSGSTHLLTGSVAELFAQCAKEDEPRLPEKSQLAGLSARQVDDLLNELLQLEILEPVRAD